MKSSTLLGRVGVVAVLLLAPPPVRAQPPAGPPPPTSGQANAGPEVHELLPDLGRIGAQVGVTGGVSFDPYDTGTGFDVGGFIDLPLARVPGGKLSYEILLAYSDAESSPFTVTDSVAYVANLAAGASPSAALAGPPQAPFPVRRDARLALRLLQISPFSLKWTLLGLDHARLRPFFGAGLDFIVVITQVNPVRDESLQFTGTAPFDAPLIGGQIAQAPELEVRGVPSGQGNLELGGHAMAGFEIRLARGVSLNLEYRFTQIGKGSRLQTINGGLGIHW
jgi:opacity protein-like surface antigen